MGRFCCSVSYTIGFHYRISFGAIYLAVRALIYFSAMYIMHPNFMAFCCYSDDLNNKKFSVHIDIFGTY